jgi:4-amino-4-deoxy-L-arabinose transferase-like glycosyltransferase
MWEHSHGLIIDSEGVEYARLAQNLRSGHGYVGIFNNGIQLNFPPLYPLLIAGLSFLLPSFELSARVINVVLGALPVIPMFKLAERIYGVGVAILVAVLVSFHPLLIARSVLCCSETPYLTILMGGIYYVIRWVDEHATKSSILAGIFFGLAYLIRPEAFVIVGAIAGAALLSTLFVRNRRPVLLGALSLTGVFLLLASPYIFFLSVNSGKFRIEGKGSIVYAWGKKVSTGMTYTEATTKIGDDLSDEGIFMKSNYEALNAAPYSLRDLALFILRTSPRSLKKIYESLANYEAGGAPLLFFLAVIGLLRSPWDLKRALHESILLITGLAMVLTLLTLQWYWPRYFHALLGLLILWAGKGAQELGHWAHDTVASVSAHNATPKLVGRAVQWAAILSVIALSLRAVPLENEFREQMLTEHKQAGEWLAKYSPGSKWIMDTSLVPTYYAGGGLMYLPFASSDPALRYIAKKKPDFIVLLEDTKLSRPYLAKWFDEGIPDKRAELIYDVGDSHHVRIKIYRWKSTFNQSS